MFVKKVLGEAVCYVQQPGLLALAALNVREGDTSSTIAVAEGKLLRDASPSALACGVRVGESVTRARRLCPLLLIVPLESIDARPLSRKLWGALAQLSPTVEPSGPDAAFLTLLPGEELLLRERLDSVFPGLPPACLGVGPTKLAARAVAESGGERLEDAPVCSLLWPADPKVTSKLQRLGLATFGEVAAVGEGALVYQFGRKVGMLLHRRARGIDADPVRPLWPPRQVLLRRDFTLDPIEDRACLEREIERLARRASRELVESGRFARKLSLSLSTERFSRSKNVLPPLPLQSEREIHRAALRLLVLLPPGGPVTGLGLTLSELELPAARSLSLFDATSAESLLRLERARRLVVERYGPKALVPLSSIPVSLRDRRRQFVREATGR